LSYIIYSTAVLKGIQIKDPSGDTLKPQFTFKKSSKGEGNLPSTL